MLTCCCYPDLRKELSFPEWAVFKDKQDCAGSALTKKDDA